MIEIRISLYKHGDLREYEYKTFENLADLNEWLEGVLKYTDELKKQENDCGESLCKWTAEFSYNNKRYRIYLDV